MARSKVSSEDSHVDVNEGLLKQREKDKFRREVGKQLTVDKGVVRQATDKFRRHTKPKNQNTPSKEHLSPEQ